MFAHLDSIMVGREFDSTQVLIVWTKAAFERISRQGIEYVFEEWMDPVQ
jgi:hypothetical protein